jgi:16S rRNA (adenine1518-N6/adenine1519-N6)-dimethyltransferase
MAGLLRSLGSRTLKAAVSTVFSFALVKTRRPRLGQHFLTSAAYRRRLAEALPLRPDDLVLEVGAGRGALTGLLAERARAVVAVELDPRLAASLREQLRDEERIEILQADILTLDVAKLCRRHGVEQAFVFGNLPYYITSPILHHLLEFSSAVRGMALVVQREVGLRITAHPGSRLYGYLSVLAQAYSKPAVAFRIPAGAFSPPPAVQSALVRFEMTSPLAEWEESRRRRFLAFVKLGFARKRKKLASNLAEAYPSTRVLEAFRQLGFQGNARAEELGVVDLARLFEAVESSHRAIGPADHRVIG